MKKIALGLLAGSLILSQGLNMASAEGKGSKKSANKKAAAADKDANGIADEWQKKYNLGYGKYVAAKDNDKDGLTNLEEYQLKLNPILKDTDQDKLADGQEDADKDQLTNVQDIQAKTSALTADTDKDGTSDAEEDADLDELNAKEEFTVGTSPVADDSDKDGLADGEEDKDTDKLENSFEFEMGYDPNSADSDRDGIQDSKEDLDGDGISNSNEIEELEIELKSAEGKKFKLKYKLKKNKLKVEVKNEIGVKDTETIVERFTLTPSTTKEAFITQAKEILGVSTFKELKMKVEFVNGQELKVEQKDKIKK